MVSKVSIIGAGAWGTTLASILSNKRIKVKLWSYENSVAKNIRKFGINKKYLPKIKLPPKVEITTNILEAFNFSDWIISAVPTQFIRQTYSNIKKEMDGKKIINVSKGIEIGTNLRVSEIFTELFSNHKYLILSGPTFAHEVALKLPSAATLASKEKDLLTFGQRFLSSDYFRVYTSDDIIGVELGGALKNIIAIAVGIIDGLNLGKNAEAALINRSLIEIIKFGKKCGASSETFMGLSYMGDLILTCSSNYSRNRQLGYLIGRGMKSVAALKKIKGIAEGYYTVKAVYEMSKFMNIEMPITEKVFQILYENLSPQKALKELMLRELKHEWINL